MLYNLRCHHFGSTTHIWGCQHNPRYVCNDAVERCCYTVPCLGRDKITACVTHTYTHIDDSRNIQLTYAEKFVQCPSLTCACCVCQQSPCAGWDVQYACVSGLLCWLILPDTACHLWCRCSQPMPSSPPDLENSERIRECHDSQDGVKVNIARAHLIVCYVICK